MASLTRQLLAVTVVLCAVQLINSYSFYNCIEKLYGKAFSCFQRKEKNISVIVSDLPPSAIKLFISFNPIQHIPDRSFVHLPNLRHLQLSDNQLSTFGELAFYNLHQLQKLNLSSNNISQLSPSLFKDLHNLTYLSLENNRLKALPVDIFSSLFKQETLILKQNILDNFSQIALSVSHLLNLRTIDLSFNNLSSINHSNVSLPRSLSKLNVSSNNLSALGCDYSFLCRLMWLDLSFNARLPAEAFEGVDLTQLNHLHLRSTKVNIVEFLNISNVRVNSVDFSGVGLKNESLLTEFCKILDRKGEGMTKLQLSYNEIGNMSTKALQFCPKHIDVVDLSRNRLKSINCLIFLNRNKDIKSFKAEHNSITALESCLRKDTVFFQNLTRLSFQYNRILTVSTHAFYHTPHLTSLKLNMNTIAFLHRQALSGLKKLKFLQLDNNLLTDLFYENFEDQLNLKILNLRSNRISVIFNKTFRNLRNLAILDLGGNKITHFEPLGLYGLTSLSKLYLDDNNLKTIDASLYQAFHEKLTLLNLQSNQIRFISETTSSPFMNLSKLGDLSLDRQRPYGLTLLPRNFFRGLHSLKNLRITNNYISHLAPDAFDDLAGLHFLSLDNCCVGAVQLQPGVFKNLRNLSTLIVENMGLQNFSKEIFGNLTNLQKLHLNHNVMQRIDLGALESLPNLQYLDIRNVPLSCTCDNALLQNWTVNNPKVQVLYLYHLPCQLERKYKFHNFDTKVCYVDLGLYLFLTTAVGIFLFTVAPILYVKLYWTFKYSYFVFRAWFSDQWRRLREEEEDCKYDAFISYNSSDEQWVMEQLLPNLEGNGSSFKLCLHHRDFELGRNIVDNIVSAVYSSRKTICVVSRNFLKSEWCSLEIQLASYRLFDEHRDVLLLVFLETISERQMSSYHRMRKVMLKKTYLQWPGSDCSDPSQAQILFWNQLRRAMKTNYFETDSCKSCEIFPNNEAELYEREMSDTHYLLP